MTPNTYDFLLGVHNDYASVLCRFQYNHLFTE